jgi:hypothetical protein
MYRALNEPLTAELKTPFLESPDDTHPAVEVERIRTLDIHDISRVPVGCWPEVKPRCHSCREFEVYFI